MAAPFALLAPVASGYANHLQLWALAYQQGRLWVLAWIVLLLPASQILPASVKENPFTHLHLGGSSQLSRLSSVPFPRCSHLFLQLDDSGLGIAQSLVQDLNMPPMVLACIPHCCQLHFQLFLFLQEFFVWKGKKKKKQTEEAPSESAQPPAHCQATYSWQGLKIKTMQIAVSCCCCCCCCYCCLAVMKSE